MHTRENTTAFFCDGKYALHKLKMLGYLVGCMYIAYIDTVQLLPSPSLSEFFEPEDMSLNYSPTDPTQKQFFEPDELENYVKSHSVPCQK